MDFLKLFIRLVVEGKDEAFKDMDDTSKKGEGLGKKFGSAMKSVGSAVGKTTLAVASAVGTATVAMGTMATKSAMEYETNFAKVSTLLTGTEEDIANYKQAILDASTETGMAVSEMSEAVYSAISASVPEDKAVEFAKKASELARGGFTDTATAVDVLTTAINAYGMSIDDTTNISDMLINTQNLGKTTVDELGSSLGKIIPTANSVGVELDVLLGAYAEMTKNGIATAESTTYMNSMLNELGKSGTTASDTLKEATGKTFKQLMDEGMSLTDVLGILQTEADKSGLAMSDMFGSAEAGKSATVLISNASDLNDMIAQVGGTMGSTAEASEKMAGTIEARIAKLKNSATNMMVGLGETILPIVEKAMGFLEAQMPKIQSMFERIAPVVSNLFDKLLPPILELVDQVLPMLMDLVDQLIPPIADLVEAVMPVLIDAVQTFLPPIMQLVETVLPIFVTLIKELLPILQPIFDILSPILDLVIAILTPLLQLIQMILQPIIKLFVKIAEILSAVLAPAIQFIADAFELFGKVMSKIGEGIKQVFGQMKETTKQNVETMKSAMQSAGNAIKEGWTKAFNAVNEATGGKLGEMVSNIKGKLESAKQIVSDAIAKIKEFFKFEWEWPKLKMPHFKMSGKFSLNPPSVPSFGVDWYAKAMNDPIVMNSPTAFGINANGQVMAGGEAGSEVVSGTNTLMNMIATAVSAQNKALEDKLAGIQSLMAEYMPQMANMKVVMDTGATVGALAPDMDSALGRLAIRNGRMA